MVEQTKMPSNFDWRAITPDDSPKTPIEVSNDPAHRTLVTPDIKEGEEAYDFMSPIYDYSDGTEKRTGKVFRLLEVAREKPVALIFGSYT